MFKNALTTADKTRRLLLSSAIAIAAACVPACDDGDRIPGQGGDGGGTSSGGADGTGGNSDTGGSSTGGSTSSTGGSGTGGNNTGGQGTGGSNTGGQGTGGASTGGAQSTGGSSTGGQGTGGAELDASVDASPDADDGGRGAAFPSIVLASATNYSSSTVISTLDLVEGKVLGETVFSDKDTISVASDGKAFAVERTKGVVNLLTGTGTVSKRISLHSNEAGTAYLNPQNVVVVPGTPRAYVPLYQTNTVAVLDLEAGELDEILDFSALKVTSDADGSADLAGGVYDAKRNRVYFVAQRIDLFSGSPATGFAPVCKAEPSLVFAVDATSGATVDLNGSADGFAVSLQLVGPTSVTLDPVNDRLVLIAPGCAAAGTSPTRAKNGVETVDLATNQATVRYASPNSDYLGTLLLLEPNRALVQSSDSNFVNHYLDYAFGPALGAELPGVPNGAVVALPDALVGIRLVTGEGGARVPDVVRYDVTTHQVTSLLEFAWSVPLTMGLAVTVVK